MKFVMTIVMCSYWQGVCLTPFTFPTTYDSIYDCYVDGYEKALSKTKEIGIKEINKHGIFFRFSCEPSNNA